MQGIIVAVLFVTKIYSNSLHSLPKVEKISKGGEYFFTLTPLQLNLDPGYWPRLFLGLY